LPTVRRPLSHLVVPFFLLLPFHCIPFLAVFFGAPPCHSYSLEVFRFLLTNAPQTVETRPLDQRHLVHPIEDTGHLGRRVGGIPQRFGYITVVHNPEFPVAHAMPQHITQLPEMLLANKNELLGCQALARPHAPATSHPTFADPPRSSRVAGLERAPQRILKRVLSGLVLTMVSTDGPLLRRLPASQIRQQGGST